MKVCQNARLLFLCTKPRLSQAGALLLSKDFVSCMDHSPTKAVGLKCLFLRIMHRVIRITLLAVVAWLTATVVMAGTIEPFIGIVNRTDCGGFWRYDFNYETVDVDGETPIVLSAAIF